MAPSLNKVFTYLLIRLTMFRHMSGCWLFFIFRLWFTSQPSEFNANFNYFSSDFLQPTQRMQEVPTQSWQTGNQTLEIQREITRTNRLWKTHEEVANQYTRGSEETDRDLPPRLRQYTNLWIPKNPWKTNRKITTSPCPRTEKSPRNQHMQVSGTFSGIYLLN